MGMYDNIKCKYPLPAGGPPNAGELDYQTKDTWSQGLDHYEIREDGTLWIEEYDVKDRSTWGAWQKEHPGQEAPEGMFGLADMAGCMTRINRRWKQDDKTKTGEIRFYTSLGKQHTGWLEYSAYFVDGKLSALNLIEYRLPAPAQEKEREERMMKLFTEESL